MAIATSTFVRTEVARRFADIPNFIKGVSKLPRDVILHYLVDDGSVGPRLNSVTIKDLLDENEDVYVSNITELDKEDLYGRRPINSYLRSAEREYFTKHRHFSRIHNLDRVLERGNSPIIFNYNHIFHGYKSDTNRNIDKLYRNMGNFSTLWRNVAALNTDAVQIIPIRLPRIVKDLTDMQTLVRRPTQSNLLQHVSLADVYLYSLIQIVFAEEYSETLANRNIMFRIIDGINHVDIPYKLIAEEMDKKSSSPEERLKDLYDIFDALIELRVGVVDEEDTTVELKASSIKIDNTPTDVLDIDKNISNATEEMLKQGVISQAEVKRIEKDKAKFKKISVDGQTVETILKKSAEDKREVPPSTVPKFKAPVGESVMSNITQEIDRKYVEENLEQDFIENLAVMSNSGHMVLDIKKERKRDAATDEIEYSIQTKHIKGAVGTMKLQIPNIKGDGTFQSGGVKYRMGKQRMSLPIAKISPYEVAMTASKSKMFATTGRTAADNLGIKLTKAIDAYIIDDVITEYSSGSKLKPGNKMGLLEAALYENYGTLKYKSLSIDFAKGHKYKGDPVKFSSTGDLVGKENYGNILNLLDIPLDKMGKVFSEVRVKGAEIPLSIILGSWMGLDEFFKRIGVVVTEYDIAQRVDKSKGPILRFKDVKIQIQYRNAEQMLLINGLRKNEDSFREVERDSLDSPAGWKLFFTVMGLGRGQERGIRTLRTTWIDAITAKLLKRQGYPTNMIDLFLTVNRLLSTAEFSREADGDLMFIRGYDRINDIIAREIAAAMDEFEANPSPKRKLTINPKAVKMAILSDGLVSPIEDTSPINQVSNQTRLGYGGTGGRSDQSLVARHRVFDDNDLGVISEAGTDDGKAGTILNTSVNPNLDSVYGTSSKDKKKDIGNILSANTLVAPFSLHDEMKRTVFSRIQSNSMIYSEGYRVMPTYTGMGMVIPHQVDGNYCHIAKDDGTVTKVTEKFIEVKYKSGDKVKLKSGRGFSRNSGKILPKQLITDFKPKDTFRKGAVLVWDKNYFARSMVEPDQVELYTGAPVFIAIKDEMDTYEDGSAMDKYDGDTALATKVIHTRTLSISYLENFKLLVKEGDYVSPSTPIAIITPEGVEITEDAGSLDFMSRATPKAKHSGEIVRIEVNYIGDKKQASKGLRKVIDISDKQYKEESEYSDVHPNGEITEPTYINQEYLDKDSAVITLYIEHLDKYGVGDKSSDCNALKTVNGYAWQGRVETLDGIRISGKFSGDGIFRRVVTSAFSMGILNFAQYTAGRRVSDIYHGRIKK